MTPFEQYMLGDDHRAYPMSFYVRLRFAGQIEREPFQRALKTAVNRHALLAARLQTRPGMGLCWNDVGDVEPVIRWIEKADDTSYPAVFPLDLQTSTGLGTSILSNDKSSDIVFQFHHACCDGLGAFGFINDVLIAYANEQGDEPDRFALKPLEPQHLDLRRRLDLSWSRIIKMLPKQAVGLLGIRQFLMRRPTSLSGRDPVDLKQQPPSGYPRVKVLRLAPDVVAALRETARCHNVTPNHLFTSDLFLAIDDWRSKHSVDSDPWIRFSIPISLRSDKDQSLPAANKVSMVFLDRRRVHFASPIELLHSIREETQLIAKNRLELILLFSLWLTAKLHGSAIRAARTDLCHATTVLTNVGAPFARSPLSKATGKLIAGNIQLESLDIVAPLRPYTDVAFSICDYAGSCHITLHWDERAITGEQAEALLAAYQQRLLHSSY